MAKNPNKIRAKRVASDYVIDIIMIVTIVLVLVLTLYPFLNSLAISLNDSNDTTLGGLTIYPRKFTWRNYELVFTNQKIWMAYFITIARTVIGTVGGVLITGMLAFAISRTNLVGKKVYAMLCLIPMYFGGGLMPTYYRRSVPGKVRKRVIGVKRPLMIFHLIYGILTFKSRKV